MSEPVTSPGLSFGAVADSYHRGRPAYPLEAAAWLVGDEPVSVLELGAGTGKLTAALVDLGHDVHATDPDEAMLAVLQATLPDVRTSVATAERIPAPDMTYDVVVAGQAFHWFDPAVAVPEIARVLKPGGTVALAWNQRDESIPWVRRLGGLIGKRIESIDPTEQLEESGNFVAVESATFTFWQRIDQHSIVDLVLSRSNLAGLSDAEREAKRTEVLAFYDDYGRGMDGMQLPYRCHCFRATVTNQLPVRPPVPAQPVGTTVISASVAAGLTDTAERLPAILEGVADGSSDDTGMLLINFR